jgi:hypothetical protein
MVEGDEGEKLKEWTGAVGRKRQPGSVVMVMVMVKAEVGTCRKLG